MQYMVLQHLADGKFHSGQQVAQLTGVTRAAIWKAIQGLANSGIEIHAVRGRGYRLNQPYEFLDAQAILDSMSSAAQSSLCELSIIPCVDSTNAWLMRKASTTGMTACLAELQTSGRGRRGRTWQSTLGGSICLSLHDYFEDGMARLAGLSLVVALAVVRALHELGINDVSVKWPNDIYWQGRKLGGILLEISGEAAGPCSVVMGIGINVSMSDSAGQYIGQPWVAMSEIRRDISRNYLAGRVLQHLIKMIADFKQDGLLVFLEEWREVDWLYDKPLLLMQARGDVSGIGRGISADGSLRLEVAGNVECHSFGEVSVRLQDRPA
ncbi:MAG: bifunctional biotin--[acetyl-CoA-carboxylase] ligase/biotin operon repressor BirA [Thiohalomonadaceae bacterium]